MDLVAEISTDLTKFCLTKWSEKKKKRKNKQANKTIAVEELPLSNSSVDNSLQSSWDEVYRNDIKGTSANRKSLWEDLFYQIIRYKTIQRGEWIFIEMKILN